MRTRFEMHHFTLSVRSIEKSSEFYSMFGFKLAFKWNAPDETLVIAHFVQDGSGLVLEMFQYSANRDQTRYERGVGNDLEDLGVKHIAFRVADLRAVSEELRALNCGKVTDIAHGRTGIDYFFVADPDGNWVEVVQDDRALDTGNPVSVTS